MSGYDINGLVVNGYSNALMEFKIVVRYINKKRIFLHHCFSQR